MKSANNTTPEISVLLYHQIGETVYSHSNLDCLCLVGNFYEQMKYLKNNNYRVIGLKEALSSLHGHNTLDGPTVVLTFDDGDIRRVNQNGGWGYFDTSPVTRIIVALDTLYSRANELRDAPFFRRLIISVC